MKELKKNMPKDTDQSKQSLIIHDVMPSLQSLNFKEMRKSKGLTLRKVESLTGVSNSYLSQLETGKINNPSYDIVRKLFLLYSNDVKLPVRRSEKVKPRKYKCFDITGDELKAIFNAQEQIRSDAESADDDYVEWANEQMKLINSFYRKLKIQ